MNLTFKTVGQTPLSDIWFTYYGLDPANGMKPSHLDASGKIVPNEPSEKPTTALSIQVSSAPSFNFPKLSAGRLYISFEQPLKLTVDPAGNPIPPQSANPNDPNYKIPWDFFEIDYIPSGSDELFNFNLSTVQSANLPLAFQVAGTEPSTKQPVSYVRGWKPRGYTAFISALRAVEDFKGLILPGTQRVLAPGTAITAFSQGVIPKPLIAADYLKAYIAQVWVKYEKETLTFVGDPPAGSNSFVTWTGQVENGQFVFTTKDFPKGKLKPIVLSMPSTAALFENNFNFCVSGEGNPKTNQQNYALQLFGTLCAAFNRSMMLTTSELTNSSSGAWCQDKAAFYQDPTTNHYAKHIHENTVGGLAYAFQSDDHCDTSSFVSVINPTGLTINIVQR